MCPKLRLEPHQPPSHQPASHRSPKTRTLHRAVGDALTMTGRVLALVLTTCAISFKMSNAIRARVRAARLRGGTAACANHKRNCRANTLLEQNTHTHRQKTRQTTDTFECIHYICSFTARKLERAQVINERVFVCVCVSNSI